MTACGLLVPSLNGQIDEAGSIEIHGQVSIAI